MRLRSVCAVGSIVFAFGVVAPVALADSTGNTGATGATGTTGTTGATGAMTGGATAFSSTGTTGATGSTSGVGGVVGSTGATGTIPKVPRAPITLPKGVSPSAVYDGPVFVAQPSGAVVPYAPQTTIASVAGGSVAGTFISGLPHLLVPGDTAEIVNGIAAAPEGAPAVVQHIIWAANRIIGRPYVFGGGHQSFISHGYDCSGTVSFALHGGSLLSSPLDSSEFMSWGKAGQGRWMTILTNPGHAYLDIAGLRLDTSAADDPKDQQGPRWRPLRPANAGFVIRHPVGL